jgi:hypothetical protein
VRHRIYDVQVCTGWSTGIDGDCTGGKRTVLVLVKTRGEIRDLNGPDKLKVDGPLWNLALVLLPTRSVVGIT